jgi:YD repeat-containing protein
MYIRLGLAFLAILQPIVLIAEASPTNIPEQSDTNIPSKISSGENSPMTDRENAGLRGPVQKCIEERANPAFDNFPGSTHTTITEYSREGRILHMVSGNSAGSSQEFSFTYTYDSRGLLLSQTMTNPGSPPVQSKYNYDEKGRLRSITENPTQNFTFQYDDQGRKTRLLTPQVRLDSPLLVPTAISIGVLEGEDPYLPIPPGGQAKTLFNQNDEPVEWQIIDANGNLLNKLIRTYDENGRLAELRYTMENILLSMPDKAREELLAQAGSAEEVAKQFAAFLGEQRNFMRTTYKYDANGRLIEKHTYLGPSMETITKLTYNDHSDKNEEQTIFTGDPNNPGNEPSRETPSSAPLPSQTSVTRYSYKYDSFGNWTEQTITPPSPTPPTVSHRTLTYY